MLNIPFMRSQEEKRNVAKILLLIVAAAHLPWTKNLVYGLLNVPLPLLSGYTVEVIVGILVLVFVWFLHNKDM